MGCAFCATGTRGFVRNLETDEMLWQILIVEDDFGRSATAAIAMGQGEPLANYAALVDAVSSIVDPSGLCIDPDRMSVSTCGLTEGIRALARDNVPATLAVSLHSATQELRDTLMPGVRRYPLDQLHAELADYCQVTGRRAIVQYLMLNGVNDGDKDLEALATFCEGLDVYVTLLHYNLVDGIPFTPSTFGKMTLWMLDLRQRGLAAGMNKPRGADIDATCGQLAGKL